MLIHRHSGKQKGISRKEKTGGGREKGKMAAVILTNELQIVAGTDQGNVELETAWKEGVRKISPTFFEDPCPTPRARLAPSD